MPFISCHITSYPWTQQPILPLPPNPIKPRPYPSSHPPPTPPNASPTSHNPSQTSSHPPSPPPSPSYTRLRSCAPVWRPRRAVRAFGVGFSRFGVGVGFAGGGIAGFVGFVGGSAGIVGFVGIAGLVGIVGGDVGKKRMGSSKRGSRRLGNGSGRRRRRGGRGGGGDGSFWGVSLVCCLGGRGDGRGVRGGVKVGVGGGMAYGIFPCIWVKRIMWKISWKIMMALKELLDGLFKIFPLTRFLTSYIYPSPPLSYLILFLPSLKKPPVSPPSTTRKILHRNCKHLSSTPPTPNAPTDVSCTFAPRPARIVKEMDGVSVYTLLFPPTPTAVENCRTRSCPDGKRQEQKSLVWVLVEEVGYINPISSSQTHQS